MNIENYEALAYVLGTTLEDVLENPDIAYELYATLEDVELELAVLDWGKINDDYQISNEDAEIIAEALGTSIEDVLGNPEIAIDLYTMPGDDIDDDDDDDDENYNGVISIGDDEYDDAPDNDSKYYGGVSIVDDDAMAEVVEKANTAEAEGNLAGEFETREEAEEYASAAPHVLKVYAVYNRWGMEEWLYVVLREYPL